MAQAPVAAPPGPSRSDQNGGRQAGPPKAPGQAAGAPGGPGTLTELKVSGHVMTLDTGLYCIVHKPSAGGAAAASPQSGPPQSGTPEPGTSPLPAPPQGAAGDAGLPGIRVSLAPGASGTADAVEIVSFRADGWLSRAGDAALVRVRQGPAQVLMTIYQATTAPERTAPNIQVMKLLEGATVPARPPEPAAPPVEATRAPSPPRGPAVMEMIAHIQERGDVGAMFGEWLGERGSKRWIEGFGLSPTHDVAPRDIEYQAVLGQGWLSPWVEGGQFCGSRAMALPLLGLRVRLRGEALETHDVIYSASFVDGAGAGPSSNGEPCESDSLSAMEAFQVIVRRRDPTGEAAAAAAAPKRGRGKPAPEPAPTRGKPAGRKR